MRVLIPTIRSRDQIGGVSTHLTMLASGLEANGHPSLVLYLSDVLPPGANTAGIVWPAGALNRACRGWGMVYAATVRARLLAAATQRELNTAAEAGEPWDVLNVQEVYSVPALRTLADRHGIPLVLTLHGYPLYESVSEGYSAASTAGRSYLMESELRALRLADAVITVDSRLRQHVLRILPERAARTSSLMNFIDTSSFAPGDEGRREARAAWDVPDGKVVLFCPRRLVKKNGVVYPALALASMDPQERERFLLLHAGDGGERPAIERVIREECLENVVRLLGGQGREAILELYRLADIVLVPSVHSDNVEEATSLSALEAMACGRPLIAGAVGGLAEMVEDGENGLLVPEADAVALATAILRIADDHQLGRRLSDAARLYVVREHSHLQAAARFVELYREAGAPVSESSPASASGSHQPGSSAHEGAEPDVVSVLGLPVHRVGLEAAAAAVLGWARRADGSGGTRAVGRLSGREAGLTRIATSFNPELAVKAQDDPAVTEALLAADLRYPDGVGVVWAAERRGVRGLERVPGIELAERVLAGAAEEELPVYLLGASPGVAKEAAAALRARMPGLHVVGCRHGYFGEDEEREIVEAINASAAAVLLVALGAPRQELFIERHKGDLGVGAALGVGGSFDVWSGRVRRAPDRVRELGLEWIYRLATDPKRVRRQVALPVFAWRVITDVASDYHRPRTGSAAWTDEERAQ
ncbi:MAG: WecB/TagA/CpsF family glycosyltransferase [Actinobacteria bacterium]|nr:WecB/TagA/CpsF family glycosyltransferase [Actinomycetota bacterium]